MYFIWSEKNDNEGEISIGIGSREDPKRTQMVPVKIESLKRLGNDILRLAAFYHDK